MSSESATRFGGNLTGDSGKKNTDQTSDNSNVYGHQNNKKGNGAQGSSLQPSRSMASSSNMIKKTAFNQYYS
jgi:hypothetical protein